MLQFVLFTRNEYYVSIEQFFLKEYIFSFVDFFFKEVGFAWDFFSKIILVRCDLTKPGIS